MNNNITCLLIRLIHASSFIHSFVRELTYKFINWFTQSTVQNGLLQTMRVHQLCRHVGPCSGSDRVQSFLFQVEPTDDSTKYLFQRNLWSAIAGGKLTRESVWSICGSRLLASLLLISPLPLLLHTKYLLRSNQQRRAFVIVASDGLWDVVSPQVPNSKIILITLQP